MCFNFQAQRGTVTMKLLALFMAVMCFSFPAFSGETAKGEVLAVLRTPQNMSLTEDSLKNGEIRKYIDLTAASADARVVSIWNSRKTRMLFQRYRTEKYTFIKQSLRPGKLNPGLLLI